MNVLVFGLAILFSLLLVAGWVMLLSMPLVILSATTVGVVVKGVGRAKRFVSALAKDTVRGILCIDGLVSEPALVKRLRSDIARVLKLAAPGTNPRACACVKESEGAFVGVLRVFNTKGHYLLRPSGASAAAIAKRFSATLDEFGGTFPAREGARRVKCPECNPKTCPLLRLKRERALAVA